MLGGKVKVLAGGVALLELKVLDEEDVLLERAGCSSRRHTRARLVAVRNNRVSVW